MHLFKQVSVVLLLLMGLCLPTMASDVSDYLSLAPMLEQQYKLPVGLLATICTYESHGQNVKGAHGEIGVCQIKPDTIRHAFGDTSYVSPRLQYVALGSKGPLVETIRKMLVQKGYIYAEGPSSVFDVSLMLVIKGYQASHHLRIDGVVGPQTWGSLLQHPSIEEQLWNPKTNIEYAAKYLQWLSKVLNTNDPMILAAAYNGGPANPIVRYMINIQNTLSSSVISTGE